MISSEEFQQKLQSGEIHAALALLIRDGAELDITTQIGANIAIDQSLDRSTNHVYLRTKINLLTGSVHNEVGEDLAIDSPDYLQLHQLHLDQIVTSHNLIESYQNSLKEILLALSSSPSSSINVPQQPDLARSFVRSNQLNSDALMAKLIQSSVPGRDDRFGRIGSTTMGKSSIGHSIPIDQASPVKQEQSRESSILPVDNQQQYFTQISPIAEDLDLSIVHEGEVWEEWIEDEGIAGSLDSAPPLIQTSSSVAPDRSGPLTRRQLHPIDVKPMMPRQSKSIKTPASWEQFVPEHLGLAPEL
jgi:hypothetical protein